MERPVWLRHKDAFSAEDFPVIIPKTTLGFRYELATYHYVEAHEKYLQHEHEATQVSQVTELSPEIRTTEPKNWLQHVNRLEISELESGDF